MISRRPAGPDRRRSGAPFGADRDDVEAGVDVDVVADLELRR